MAKGPRYLLGALGVLIGLPLIFVLYLVVESPLSFVGALYLAGSFLAVAGLISAPWAWQRSLLLILIGDTLLLITLAVRISFPPSGSQLNIITLPGQSGPRLINRILNEQDVVLLGAHIAPFLGAVSPLEEQSLVFSLSQTYEEMRTRGVTPLSPFLTTYLNQQRSNNFDVLSTAPLSGPPPLTGIIFLHGHGGNFTLQCWLVARAGIQIGAITVCPSTDHNGQWWNEQGAAILQETLTYLHQRGVERIYLAGLSNGGIGASRLADPFKADLAGLILISGADPTATITELPVLVVHGKYDERITVSLMEQYVNAAGTHATYHLYEGDHFLLLKQADQVKDVILDWLNEH